MFAWTWIKKIWSGNGIESWESELKDVHGEIRAKLYDFCEKNYLSAKKVNENYRVQTELLLRGLDRKDLTDFIEYVYVEAFVRSLLPHVDKKKRDEVPNFLKQEVLRVIKLVNNVFNDEEEFASSEDSLIPEDEEVDKKDDTEEEE